MSEPLKSNIRLLAAIMFTDIVGYTALMQEDEVNAKAIRDKHRRVLEELTLAHNGQILQYYGDGTLTIFASAIEAVEAARKIQKELVKEPKIPLRIGLHLGDIVYEDDGVYGDGVNIASRIESMSVPGGVLLSDKVYDELHNHPELETESLGKFNLKNVKRDVEIFALVNDGLNVPDKKELNKIRNNNTVPSIAVLPFVNMSTDKENEFFSDGITEELLNALAKVDGLRVTSRTSSFAFKGMNAAVKEIAEQLNVKYILEGSVRKSVNKVRVTAQLINAFDDFHIWSDTYDRSLEDIFEVQDEISNKIVNTLRAKLLKTKGEKPLVKHKTENIASYGKFLEARHYWYKHTPGNTMKAIKLLEEVIQEDSKYSQAYSAIASCYIFIGAIGYMNIEQAYGKAKNYVAKALELEPDSADAHASLGMIKLFFDWDFDGAKKELDHALSLKQGSGDIHNCLTLYYLAIKDYKNAIHHAEEAVILDPLSLPYITALADSYFNAGMSGKALEQIEKVLEIDSEYRNALQIKGMIKIHLGDFKEARQIFYFIQKLTKDELKGVAGIGYIEALLGNKEAAMDAIKKLDKRSKRDKDITLYADYSLVYFGLKDYDKGFEYLNKAFDSKMGGMIFITKRFWKTIADDDRYKELVDRIGLSKFIVE